MEGPKCKATVSLDISNMKDGDVAGFSAFNGHSGLLSVVKEGDTKRLVMSTNVVNFDNTPNKAIASVDVEEQEQVELNQDIIYLRIEGDFTPKRDIATFYYSLDNKEWRRRLEQISKCVLIIQNCLWEVSLPSLTMQRSRWEVMSTLTALTTRGPMIG